MNKAGDYRFFKKSMNPVVLVEKCESNIAQAAWSVMRIHGKSKGKRLLVPDSALIGIDTLINQIGSDTDTLEDEAAEVLRLVRKYNWPVYIDPGAGEQIAEPGILSVSVCNSGYWLNTFKSHQEAKIFCEKNQLALSE